MKVNGMSVRPEILNARVDAEMVEASGVNIRRVFLATFVLGSALAGLGGLMGGAFLSETARDAFDDLLRLRALHFRCERFTHRQAALHHHRRNKTQEHNRASASGKAGHDHARGGF